jgi:hypothetical protein
MRPGRSLKLLTCLLSLKKSCYMASAKSRQLVLDPFGLRQFNNPSYTGTQVMFNEEEFERRVNEMFEAGLPLTDGYAPFCKHLFIPNFANVRCGYAAISEENKHLIESYYEARYEFNKRLFEKN